MDGKDFEGLLDAYFEKMLEAQPIYNTIFTGLKQGEGKLGSQSLRFFEQREGARQAALKELDSVCPRELSAEQHLDRLAFRSLLLKECEDYARGKHTLDPAAPGALLEILLHELQRGEDHPTRAAANIRSLLRRAPQFLEEAANTILEPERLWLRIMEETVDGAPSLLEAVTEFLRLNRPQPDDADLAHGCGRALSQYRDTIRKRAVAPAGSYALGKAGMERRVRDELGLDYTLGQIETLAESEVKRVKELQAAEARRISPGATPDEVLAEARASWRPERPLLELYQAETRRMAQLFKNTRAVSFPADEELRIRPVPEFMRPVIATAAYNPPGAFEKRQRGVFWVKEAAGTTEAERVPEERQHFGVPLTCAHEAYPGHHLQFVCANQHPRKWRRLFAHAVFYEGWTLWCEQMTVDLAGKTLEPALKLQQLHDALWRCHRILIDLRLQTGRYTPAQAARHLQRELDFTSSRAEAEINWYSGQPAIPMSYWLGRLEMERLRQRLIEGKGWSLRKFNDWLLSFGTLPQAWIEKYGEDRNIGNEGRRRDG